MEAFELIPREVSGPTGREVAYCAYEDADLLCAMRSALPKLLALLTAQPSGSCVHEWCEPCRATPPTHCLKCGAHELPAPGQTDEGSGPAE
jgi:hypothetical protein